VPVLPRLRPHLTAIRIDDGIYSCIGCLARERAGLPAVHAQRARRFRAFRVPSTYGGDHSRGNNERAVAETTCRKVLRPNLNSQEVL
jgi:hypothetical protein